MIPIVSSSHTALRRLLLVALVATIPLACLAQTTPTINGKATERLSTRSLWSWGYWSNVYDYAMSGQVLVSLLPTVGQAQLDRMLSTTGCTLLYDFKTPGLYLIGLPEGMSVPDGLARMRAQSIVKSASPDQVTYVCGIPNDPSFAQQWHWTKIGMPAAWDVQTGSASTVVAVVDSGVDVLHEDLQGRFWTNPGEVPGNGLDDDNNGYIDDVNGYDFVNGNGDPSPNDDAYYYWDVRQHGTHMAGIIGANGNNSLGVAGANWQCKLMPVQIYSDQGTEASTAIKGFEYAVANGADIVNLSITSFYVPEWTPPIKWAYDQGVVIVAAGGNRGWNWTYSDAYAAGFTDDSTTWLSPVCNDGPMLTDDFVIGVGAVDAEDTLTQYSVIDQSHRSLLDVMAPGEDIYSTGYTSSYFHNSYWAIDGTSASAAIVTGLASLILADTPNATPSAVRQRLVNSCLDINSLNPLFVGMMGAGRVSASACFVDTAPGAPRSVTAKDTPGDEGGSITITWGLSVDDGRGANDITRYAVLRSDTAEGQFVEIASLSPGTSSYLDTPVDDGTDYYYKVIAYDAKMSASSDVTSPAQARDDLAPPAVNFTAEDKQGDEGGCIVLRWSGFVAPDDFKEFRIYRSEEDFSSVLDMEPLARVSDRTATSYQDRSVEDNTDYYYAVTAVDNELVSNEQTQVDAVGPVRANPNYTFSFPAGLSMISLGLEIPNMDLSQLVSNGATLCRYNPATNTYAVYPGSSATDTALLAQAEGKGYWLRTATALTLNLSGSAPTGDTEIPFVAGWNQLGNPYVDEVSIVGARVVVSGTSLTLEQSNDQGLTAGYAWIYDNTTRGYKLVSESLPFSQQTMRRGDGFFFYASRSGNLILDNPRAVATSAVLPAATQTATVDWAMRLSASVDGAADTDNFLGVCSEPASVNGIASPPVVAGGVDLSFVGEGSRSATSFVKSLGDKQEWQTRVTCAQAGAQV
ncbi:MAG: S8 family serine peptidase, partial [Armatimonadia bacterium]